MQTVTLRASLIGLSFGKRVLTQRRFLGMTQEELAAKVGIDRGTIMNYELGRTLPRTQATRRRLAEVLELEYEELYDVRDGFASKAKPGASMGIDFRQLRRSMSKNNGFQLRCWKKMIKLVLEHVELMASDREGMEKCLVEIARIQKERKARNKR